MTVTVHIVAGSLLLANIALIWSLVRGPADGAAGPGWSRPRAWSWPGKPGLNAGGGEVNIICSIGKEGEGGTWWCR